VQIWRLRVIAAAVVVLVVSGCGKPNPLIGQWKLALSSKEKMMACKALAGVEFTDKTVTTSLGPTKNTVTVTYDRDGDSYLASAGNGQAYRVKIEPGGIEANGCHLVPAGARSNPLIGDWKPASQDGEGCRGMEKIEFADETMTVILTAQAQREGEMSRKTSFGVDYSRDGDDYVATSANGQVTFRVTIEPGGIKIHTIDAAGASQGFCYLFPAS
jgi:hypothetical protein